ncbi:hypothetical protein LIX17_25780 (plasmid) [Mycobacterium avium subsp. hominissuis]|uniref:hypothetical protein n=1 Tax=Mycobacterium avium TaxID=1764 RepID=UPI003140A0D0
MDWPDAAAGRDRRQSGDFDVDWPYRDHDVAGFLAHATPVGTIDEDALPPQLAAKRRRRGHQHTTYPPITWRQLATHPAWRYTPSERRALRAATICWPTSREDLAGYANADVLEAEWDARFGHTHYTHAGAAALVWPEPNAITAAYRSAKSARHSRLWKTDLLDVHHARIDIDGRLNLIVAAAHRLWRTHADTHLHFGSTDTDDWTRLLTAIDALTEYARILNGRADRLIAYREILCLDVEDRWIRLEFGLPLESTALDRQALDRVVEQELSDLLDGLASTVRDADVPPSLGAPE